jgi:nitroimidazol reductase NimA-like FMN-containing flavoprotein (pyridoxamine 5'-phosphate oxidase superfamily)
MLIKSMSKQESIELLMRTRLGRLACEYEGQPYVVPLSFACDKTYLYAFTTEGQKLTWMRANPRVCVEFDELVAEEDWATVVVIGQLRS